MRVLTFLRPGRLEWREAAAPCLQGPGEALVRPLSVARCDLDRAVLSGEAPFRGRFLHFLRNHLPPAVGQRGLFRNAPFRGPYAFGHEFLGVVTEVGDSVRAVRPGSIVGCSFQICCGLCGFCRDGLTGNCSGVPPRSMYGFGELGGDWGGALSDLVRVPFADFMLVPLPAGMDPLPLGSLPDNIVDGWRTVGPWLNRRPGGTVLVVGGGAVSIGLYAAGIAVALGASTVTYVDADPGRRAIARRLGVPQVLEAPPERVRPEYDVTVEASASTAGLSVAIRATRPGGVCTSVGIYYSAQTPMPLLAMYGTGITFVHGRVNSRPCMDEVLPLVQSGRFQPALVTGLTAPWEDAADALLDPAAKVIVTRSG
jgi:threonine dehydrogenase-like Zn-dependent dehydrogenase